MAAVAVRSREASLSLLLTRRPYVADALLADYAFAIFSVASNASNQEWTYIFVDVLPYISSRALLDS